MFTEFMTKLEITVPKGYEYSGNHVIFFYGVRGRATNIGGITVIKLYNPAVEGASDKESPECIVPDCVPVVRNVYGCKRDPSLKCDPVRYGVPELPGIQSLRKQDIIDDYRNDGQIHIVGDSFRVAMSNAAYAGIVDQKGEVLCDCPRRIVIIDGVNADAILKDKSTSNGCSANHKKTKK